MHNMCLSPNKNLNILVYVTQSEFQQEAQLMLTNPRDALTPGMVSY